LNRLYKPDNKMGDYLKEAGGPTRFADKKQMFVIRADGSVCSKAEHGALKSADMHPGDTLVVPTNTVRGSVVRNFLDWSQAVGGIGMSTAAVNVLR
jgi:hypothetical protein